MRNAEMLVDVGRHAEVDCDRLIEELYHLYKTLPLDTYFGIVEDFTDQARQTVATVKDPDEREKLRSKYRMVVESAVDLACGIAH